MFQSSELCLPVFGCIGGGRGGANTQSVITSSLSQEVFDTATYNKSEYLYKSKWNVDEIDTKQP
jgi:hypothetical protein